MVQEMKKPPGVPAASQFKWNHFAEFSKMV
jgi:hypothetical protein